MRRALCNEAVRTFAPKFELAAGAESAAQRRGRWSDSGRATVSAPRPVKSSRLRCQRLLLPMNSCLRSRPRAQAALTPKPTRTTTPVPTPLPTRPPLPKVVVDRANLRAGPGTVYAGVGTLDRGTSVRPLQQTRDGQWIRLSNDRWLFRALVDGVPDAMPVADAIPHYARADLHADTAGLDRARRIIAGVREKRTGSQSAISRETPESERTGGNSSLESLWCPLY